MSASLYHPKYQALRAAMVASRKAAGLTQIQIAERLHVGQSFVSKMERAATAMSMSLPSSTGVLRAASGRAKCWIACRPTSRKSLPERAVSQAPRGHRAAAGDDFCSQHEELRCPAILAGRSSYLFSSMPLKSPVQAPTRKRLLAG